MCQTYVHCFLVSVLGGVSSVMLNFLYLFQVVCQLQTVQAEKCSRFLPARRAQDRRSVACPHCGKDDFNSPNNFFVHKHNCKEKN